MFKNLSMWLWDTNPDGDQAQQDTRLLRMYLVNWQFANEVVANNTPYNPDHSQVRASGLLELDQFVLEKCTDPKSVNTFLPLTHVSRERVIDKGAVKFEDAERVKHIFTME